MTKTRTEGKGETVFVVKDIVRKKKNPQQKMERYFRVTKPKGTMEEKNSQRFTCPMIMYVDKTGTTSNQRYPLEAVIVSKTLIQEEE